MLAGRGQPPIVASAGIGTPAVVSTVPQVAVAGPMTIPFAVQPVGFGFNQAPVAAATTLGGINTVAATTGVVPVGGGVQTL